MRIAAFVFPLFALFACTPAATEERSTPPDPGERRSSGGGGGARPPSPSSADVDAFGNATDPEIARCMSSLDTRQGVAATIVGESSVKENKSDEWKWCWCRTRGHRGLGTDGTCI